MAKKKTKQKSKQKVSKLGTEAGERENRAFDSWSCMKPATNARTPGVAIPLPSRSSSCTMSLRAGAMTRQTCSPFAQHAIKSNHVGKIPADSLRSWKMLLLSINEAYESRSVDILLSLFKLDAIKRVSGDGVLRLAPLIASELVGVREYYQEYKAGTGGQAFAQEYLAELTDKGKAFRDGLARRESTGRNTDAGGRAN